MSSYVQLDPARSKYYQMSSADAYLSPNTYSSPYASEYPPPTSNGPSAQNNQPEYANGHLQSFDNGNAVEIGQLEYTPPTRNRFGLTPKALKRIYILLPFFIIGIVLVILFEVYKSDFERWVMPLTDWLKARDSWSWVLPVVILIILSFPPLFGHEMQLIVGLTFPLGIGIGIAVAGAILGEAACFIFFKLFGTNYVDRKCAKSVKWAATARVASKGGFKLVLIIRYSLLPPHLVNPLFATTHLSFWIYMVTVVLSLPKQIIFVALGQPNTTHTTANKVGKVIAFGVLAIVSLFATHWIRQRLDEAKMDIRRERGYKINPAPPGARPTPSWLGGKRSHKSVPNPI